MSNPLPCDQAACGVPCQDAPRTLAEVCQQFEREAVRGVCDMGRYRCSYFTWGQGPPLTFVHGLGDAARAYLPVVARLACGFRCIAYDLPSGRGDGARLPLYTHDQLVQDLFALLDQLGQRQSYVFGSSFGATIALAAMHAQPARIPRGILAGGFARRRLAPAERLLAGLARWWPGTMRHVPFRKLVSRGVFGPLWQGTPDLWQFFLETSGTPSIAAVARRALLLHQLDLQPLLPQIRQPVLLVCGDHDPLVQTACEQVLLQGLPHVQRVELQECGHLAHYSHAEVLALLVRQFLTPPGQAHSCVEPSCQASCSDV